MRLVDETVLEDMTLGSTVLGSGGGGDPYVGKLLARDAIRRYGPVQLVDIEEVPDDANLCFVAGVGAPGVLIEKLPRAHEFERVLGKLQDYTGITFDYIAPVEAGGLNAVTPFPTAAAVGIPVVDADGMGRAFPYLELVTPTLFGQLSTPAVLIDEHDNVMFLENPTNKWCEDITRATVLASGAIAVMALYPMTGAQAKKSLVRGPLTLAEKIGRTLREAREEHRPPVQALLDEEDGVLLFSGKVSEVDRRNEGGWTLGTATLAGIGADAGDTFTIRFQNENLAAERNGEVVATTPDLIMAMEIDTGVPIPAEEIRYGYRVAVIGLRCDPRWRTPEGLAIAGPRRFGYDVDYRPVEEQRA